MTENARKVMNEYRFFTKCFNEPIVAISHADMKRICERVATLEEHLNRAVNEAGYLLSNYPTLDCRACDYEKWCPEPTPGEEPDIETCRAALHRYCDPNFKLEEVGE